MDFVIRMQEVSMKNAIMQPLLEVLRSAGEKLKKGEKLTDQEQMMVNIAMAGFMGAAK